jgi:hypothetical protein
VHNSVHFTAAVSNARKSFIILTPGANDSLRNLRISLKGYKTFYRGNLLLFPQVILPFCVIKQYQQYHDNYNRMAVNYHGKKFDNFDGKLKYKVIYCCTTVICNVILTVENVDTGVDYRIFLYL